MTLAKVTAVITLQSYTESLFLAKHYALDQKGEGGPYPQLTKGMLAVNSMNTIPRETVCGWLEQLLEEIYAGPKPSSISWSS